MENYGLTTVSEFLGDLLIYRNLQPIDHRLPGFREVAAQIGLGGPTIPRKSEPTYARIVAFLLQRTRALEPGAPKIQRLVYIGDTRMNDGIAFANLCEAGEWPGIAFIGSESEQPEQVELVAEAQRTLYLANRWAMLRDFHRYCSEHGFPIDNSTAVVIDLDKTALGARGRNDRMIDQARVVAVRETVETLLGDAFNRAAFEASYDLLNRTEFHPFTADNQDYLAYVCLILGSGLISRDKLVEKIRSGELKHFTEFLASVDATASDLPETLRELHSDIHTRVRSGDPTPFKAFRYNEYVMTVQRMGHLDPKAPAKELLAHEIVITQEVRQAALAWLEQGALIFALSDKPDEASIPAPELVARGYRPIHRTPTHAVGTQAR